MFHPVVSAPFALSLWLDARLLPFYARKRSLKNLLRRSRPSPALPSYRSLEPDDIVKSVKESTARPLLMRKRRCLREGLLAFHYLWRAGYRPKLHFGIIGSSMKEGVPKAHCWVSLDDQIILNPPTSGMIELFSFDGGKQQPSASKEAGAFEEYAKI